jgi:hypothetical protein
MGAFDDLIPKASAPSAAPVPKQGESAFADLIPKAPEPEKPGMAMSAARGAMQGLTFGLADESYGLTQGVKGLFSGEGFGAGYERGVNEYRGKDKAAKEANPITSIVGEVAGGMGTGLGAARAGLTLMKGGMNLPQAVGRSAVEGAAYGALSGAGNAEGDLASRAEGAVSGAGIGAGIGAAVPAIARGIGAATGRAITPMTVAPERQAMIDVLEREGVPLSAGQRSGSTPLRYAESIFGDATLAGGKASDLMTRQGEAFTDAALRKMGGSGRATPDNMSANYDRIGNQFKDLAARNTLQVDQGIANDLVGTVRDYQKVLPSEQRAIVGNLADDIANRFRAGNGTMPGADYQTARSRLSRMANNARQNDPEFADAVRGLRNALDNDMIRSISPDDASAWQNARREYGNWKDLAKAAGGAGANTAEGLVSPQALRSAVASGKNKEAYVRGEGDFADLARAGNGVMTPLPNSGTGQRNMMTGQVGGGGAALATGDPLTAAIVALGPSAFGRALWSGPVQKYLSNQAISPQLRAVIESKARAALQGGAQTQSDRLLPDR